MMKFIMNLVCGIWVSFLVEFFKDCGADISVGVHFTFVAIGILLFQHITRKDIKYEK